MDKFISFSGGVESSTMCLLYGEGAKAIWCDTGAEHDILYKRMDDCEKFFKDYHNGNFELIRIKASVKAKGRIVDNLTDYIKTYKYMPSGQSRFCTSQFKIKPIDDFLSKKGDCELLIGLNADEEPMSVRTGNLMKGKNIKYSYPLYESGIDREECEKLLVQYGIHPNFPVYMSRGGV